MAQTMMMTRVHIGSDLVATIVTENLGAVPAGDREGDDWYRYRYHVVQTEGFHGNAHHDAGTARHVIEHRQSHGIYRLLATICDDVDHHHG